MKMKAEELQPKTESAQTPWTLAFAFGQRKSLVMFTSLMIFERKYWFLFCVVFPILILSGSV